MVADLVEEGVALFEDFFGLSEGEKIVFVGLGKEDVEVFAAI